MSSGGCVPRQMAVARNPDTELLLPGVIPGIVHDRFSALCNNV